MYLSKIPKTNRVFWDEIIFEKCVVEMILKKVVVPRAIHFVAPSWLGHKKDVHNKQVKGEKTTQRKHNATNQLLSVVIHHTTVQYNTVTLIK